LTDKNLPFSSHTLVIGYGNLDRQDDGVAWHILHDLAKMIGCSVYTSVAEVFHPETKGIYLLFSLQLIPEMAELLAEYPRACFVDAHTGRVPEELHVEELDPRMQTSPFTHHMTPNTCLAMAQAIFGRAPLSILISVRGYDFGFAQELSPQTTTLAIQAAQHIYTWLISP
jgi:hydrogenase maturation protease